MRRGHEYRTAQNLSLPAWKDMANAHRQTIAEFDQWDNVQAVITVCSIIGRPSNLPMGNVHADVFPDNVFFSDGQIAGLIDFISPAQILCLRYDADPECMVL